MDASTIIALVGVVILALGSVAGLWRFLESKIEKATAVARVAEADAQTVRLELAAHRLHVAETYVTKAGMTEQTQQIMGAIKAVDAGVGRLNERIDRMIERQAAE